MLLPWRLASRIYGPYRMLRLTASGVVTTVGPAVLGPAVQPVVSSLAEQALDPLVERLLLPRALLGLGLVLLIVRIATGTSGDDLITEVFGDSVVMLLSGPVALLLGCLALVLLARSGTRGRVTRLVARPFLTGLFTAVLFVTIMKVPHDSMGAVGSSLPGFFLGLWLSVFTLAVLYLVHRNSFAVRAHPLVRPIVAILLVWLTVVGHMELIDTKGTETHGAALFGLLAGPVGVTVTAVIELVTLRRRHRVGFRGPLAPRL
ncbi:hypothetical protein [Kitasatospora aureofaciens]|uniref:hypothetical protein n=1 Tax=Kitasatospora aureofaciens TaxID=1894 RepID=UPI001C48149E|nr:hypothetical protein [Kitasatospora aureofaciens]MBV6697799.1 hypothetical protein [Kitasatospora aureofaciens]